ncbi:ejaculatory bulb-specific protein 3-like [Maniola hyperantus]|uniref:ejaculatory bulb-specific protein 3-like n=1 Tax=Aphantopus hyperantus TaxID=2795564 RepID=UPI0015688C42|nr:ejaculatory bulb-specific protein 3-like isoform X2 [Maniola hyperantus]
MVTSSTVSFLCNQSITNHLPFVLLSGTMWPTRIIFLLFTSVLADMIAPGIDRSVSDGVTSMGYNVLYGDEDLTVINQVVGEEEKWNAMTKSADVYRALPPLPAQDVKCLMSVDRYCSKDMGKMKNILIQALKDDCSKCSKEEKESTGRVVASMMAHDPNAWKLFLTRYDSLNKIQRVFG